MATSVIIPAFNAEKYIAGCLDSILGQDYTDFEIIAVDDGSTDSTGSILDEYAAKHHNITAVHTPNKGVSAARNTGVSLSHGQWITFVDADDMLHPQFMTQMHGVRLATQASMVQCEYTPDTRRLGTQGRTTVFDTTGAIESTLYQTKLNCSVWGKLIPRQALVDAQFKEGIRYEDLEACHRIIAAAAGKVACTTAAMYYYRTNPDSFINTFTPSRLDVLTVTENIEKHYAGNPRLLAAARDRRLAANFNMMLLCHRAGLADQAEKCWDIVKAYRLDTLLNPKARLKNRLGAAVSYLGARVSRIIYGILTR